MSSGLPNASVETPSLLGLGPAWTKVGYGVFALALASLVLGFLAHPFLPMPAGGAIPAGYRALGGEGAPLVNATPLGVAAVFLLVTSALASFVWTLIDIFDRKKRFVWLLPMCICPLVQGLHAIPLGLYLFVARNNVGHGEGVK